MKQEKFAKKSLAFMTIFSRHRACKALEAMPLGEPVKLIPEEVEVTANK